MSNVFLGNSHNAHSNTTNPFVTDLEPLLVGRIGFTIYGVLFLIALIRTLIHFTNKQAPGFTIRKAFHLVICINTILESCSYIPMAFQDEQNYKPWSFVLHMLAISFDLTAFSLVTLLWTKTIDEKVSLFLLSFRLHCEMATDIMATSTTKLTLFHSIRIRLAPAQRGLRRIFPLVLFIDLLFFIYSTYVCFDLIYECNNNPNMHYDDDNEYSVDSWAKDYSSYKFLILFEPTVLTFNAIFVILFGAKTIHKIVSMQLWIEFPMRKRVRILSQTFFTMYTCAFCYVLRSCCLIALFIQINENSNLIDTTALWWFGAIWSPTIVPSSLLLYAMRNLDKEMTKLPTAMDSLPALRGLDAPRWSSFSRSVFNENGYSPVLSDGRSSMFAGAEPLLNNHSDYSAVEDGGGGGGRDRPP